MVTSILKNKRLLTESKENFTSKHIVSTLIFRLIVVIVMMIHVILICAFKMADFLRDIYNFISLIAMLFVLIVLTTEPLLLRKNNQDMLKKGSFGMMTAIACKIGKLLCVFFLIFMIAVASAFAGFNDGFISPWWVFYFGWSFLAHLVTNFALFIVEIIILVIKNKKLNKDNKQNEESLL